MRTHFKAFEDSQLLFSSNYQKVLAALNLGVRVRINYL